MRFGIHEWKIIKIKANEPLKVKINLNEIQQWPHDPLTILKNSLTLIRIFAEDEN